MFDFPICNGLTGGVFTNIGKSTKDGQIKDDGRISRLPGIRHALFQLAEKREFEPQQLPSRGAPRFPGWWKVRNVVRLK